MPGQELRPGAIVELALADLDELGAATGELAIDGQRIRAHVAGALPGERVRARLTHLSPHAGAPRDAWAELLSVSSRSADRVAPACPASGTCGGCALMVLAYPAQLAYKRARVTAHLVRHAGLAAPPVDPCIGSPAILGYRNQAKYVYGRLPGSPQPVLGAFAPRSHRLADLGGCRVVAPVLDQLRGGLLELLRERAVEPFDEHKRSGLLRYVVMHANRVGAVLVTLVMARDWAGADELAAALSARCPATAGVVLNVNPTAGNRIFGGEERRLCGSSTLDDEVGEVRVRLSSRSFFQANRDVAGLIQAAVVAAAPRPMRRAVDVYAGAAPFALALAPLADEVIAIEENGAATASAAALIGELGGTASRIRVVTGDASPALAAIRGADLIVLDPPRKGCAPEVLAAVARLRPGLVAYVSCDPASLARDLATLVASGGRVLRLTPFDLMPHTPHVETLALLAFPH